MSHVSMVTADEFCDGHGRAVPALAGGALTAGAVVGAAGLLGNPADPRLDALLPFAIVFLGLLGLALVLGSILRLSPRALGGVGLAAWLLVALAAAPLAWTVPAGGDLATAGATERRILLRTAAAVEDGLDRLTGGAGMAGLAAACAAPAGTTGGGDARSDGAGVGNAANGSAGAVPSRGAAGGQASTGMPAKQTTSGPAIAASALGFSFALVPAAPPSDPAIPAIPVTQPSAGQQNASPPTTDQTGTRQSTTGQSTTGQSTTGQSTGGQPTGGQPTAGTGGSGTSGSAGGGGAGGAAAGAAAGAGTVTGVGAGAGTDQTGSGAPAAPAKPPADVCEALQVVEQLAGTDFTTADGAALDALGDALRDIVTLAAGGPEAETLAAGARALLTDLGRLSAMLGDRSLGDVLDRTAGTAGGTDAGTGAVPSSPAPSGPAVAPSAAAGSTGSGEGTQTAGGGSASAPGTGGVSGSGSGSGGEAGTTPWTDLLTGLAPFLLAAALALFAARAAAVMFGWVRASSWPYPEASVPA